MLRCPKCSSSLAPVDPRTGLALGCAGCGGLWARAGALEALPAPEGAVESSVRAPNDERTGLCPDGHGILLRGRVDEEGAATFYLERCPACRGVWFDAGEWSRIASSPLRSRLDELWDPAARRDALRARQEARLAADLRARLGDALYDDLVRVVTALESHEGRGAALAFIADRLA